MTTIIIILFSFFGLYSIYKMIKPVKQVSVQEATKKAVIVMKRKGTLNITFIVVQD